jgi:anti-sigma regulatory factor (Ser/Thr protein kinase)
VVDEAVSNAVEHAYPDPIPAQTHRDGTRVELSVSDTTATDDTNRVVVQSHRPGRGSATRGFCSRAA